jgi:CRP-like cAMP-binding protein
MEQIIAKQFIESIFSDAKLSEDEMYLVMGAFTKVEFDKGEYLIKEGQVLNQYYFLEEGFIRSFMLDYNGNEITTHFCLPNDIVIDWSSFMLRIPTKECFMAMKKSVCWQISYEKFQGLFHNIKGFREAGRTRLTQSYFNLKESNVAMISTSAKERYLKLEAEYPSIIQNASQKHIATYLGITDTSLSRIRKEIVGK